MYENSRTKLGKAEMKLAHINKCKGPTRQINEITLLLEESNIDILAITETTWTDQCGTKQLRLQVMKSKDMIETRMAEDACFTGRKIWMLQ